MALQRKTTHFDIDHYLNPYIPHSRLDRLPRPISHFLGHRPDDRPQHAPKGPITAALWAWIGAFCGVAMLEGIHMQSSVLREHGAPLIIGSFGAVAVLDYGCTTVPFAQPRNALVGNFLAAVIGVGITKLLALSSDFERLRWLAGALACATASGLMSLTKTIHPPAGATALLAATDPQITKLGWYYLGLVMLGSVLMLAVACVLNNIQLRYPMYWWTPDVLRPQQSEDDSKDVDIEKKDTNHSTSSSSSSDGPRPEPPRRVTSERLDSVMSHGGEGISEATLRELERQEGSQEEISEDVLQAMRSIER